MRCSYSEIWNSQHHSSLRYFLTMPSSTPLDRCLFGLQEVRIDDAPNLWPDLVVQHSFHLCWDGTQQLQGFPGIIQNLSICSNIQRCPLAFTGGFTRFSASKSFHGAEEAVNTRKIWIFQEGDLGLLQAPACQLAVMRKGNGVQLARHGDHKKKSQHKLIRIKVLRISFIWWCRDSKK